MIIDAHVHAGYCGEHYSAQFAEQMMGAVERSPAEMSVSPAGLLAEMDAAGVDRAFVLAFDVHRTLGVRVPNEFVAHLCRQHPERFIGFASVDAGTPGAADALHYAATTLALRGLKTAPAYLQLSPADRCWYEVYEVAEGLGLPVLIHTGFTPIRQANPRYFSPLLVEAVARDFPRLRVILAHLGTPWFMECLRLLARYPQLYADISIFFCCQPIETVVTTLTAARELGVVDRLLWGTDYPLCSMTAGTARTAALRSSSVAALTASEWDAVMGETAMSLIR